MIITIFAVRSAHGYFVMYAFLFVLIILSKVSPRFLLRSVKSIWFLILLAGVFQLFSGYGRVLFEFGPFAVHAGSVFLAIEVVSRLIFVVLCASLVTVTTSPIELSDAVESLMGKLPGMKRFAHELAMVMSISIRFVPVMAEEAENILKAQTSRGAPIDDRKFTGKLKGILSVAIPLIVLSLRRAEEIALAMEARGYRGWEGRTRFRELRWKVKDTVFAMIISSIIILCLFI